MDDLSARAYFFALLLRMINIPAATATTIAITPMPG